MAEGAQGPAFPEIEVVLPAHNEGKSIGQVLTEFHRIAHDDHGLAIRFLVCEDGSTDDTCDVVNELAKTLPIRLLSFGERKGYSRAAADGLRAATAEIVAFIDGDGQCDPSDLIVLLQHLDQYDLVVGYRHPRHDSVLRKLMSASFKVAYHRMFPVPLTDPSCPFLVIRRPALERALRGHPGILRQGFWWEFYARAYSAGLRVTEVPVHHRARVAGKTQVYGLTKIPRIASEHLLGLRKLRNELASITAPG
jgi:glycosyltransferase involved in cell wall biosynthesis